MLADIGTVIGATLGIFFILVIVVIGFIIYWRRFVTVTVKEYRLLRRQCGTKHIIYAL